MKNLNQTKMEKKKNKESDWLEIPVMKITQPLGYFYIGKASANEVVKICSVDNRRKVISDELDEYIGIQRELNKSKKKEIETFVKTTDASFPNSIILSAREGFFKFDKTKGILKIKKDQSACNILDGQHRLAGFPMKEGDKFELILAIFTYLDLEYQSYLFSIINTKSTRINPSLAIDLYEFSKADTPERVAHRIARMFNKTKGNPWYRKLKILGKSEEDDNGYAVLSQSTFTKYIIDLISRKEDTYQIRDILKKNNNKRKELYILDKHGKILWEKYVNEEDKYIYDLIKFFFISAKEAFSEDWDKTILTKTAGYGALMRVLKKLLQEKKLPEQPTKKYFDTYFSKVNVESLKPFAISKYKPGGEGEADLYKFICEDMGLKIKWEKKKRK